MKRLFILLGLCLYIAASAFTAMAGALDFPDAIPTSLDRTSTGSGAIVSSNGYILTNNHVIDGATTIEVVLTTGRTYEAQVIETDPDQDLALIKINGSGLPSIPVDTQRVVRVGEPVVSIGSPRGLVGTVSSGTITALNRTLGSLSLSGLYQTDTNIAPGSSGGPLIDEYGNIIGINVAVAIEGEDHVPITAFGFSIPISQAQHMLRHVLNALIPRAAALSVPDIAELCAPATVYIVCTSEIPLASLLPTEFRGYDVLNRISSMEYAPNGPDPLGILEYLRKDRIEWDSLEPYTDNPLLAPRSQLMPLRDPYTRLSDEEASWEAVGASRSYGEGTYEASVLVALSSEPKEAERSAISAQLCDMEGLEQVATGGYSMGGQEIDAVYGLVMASEGLGFGSPPPLGGRTDPSDQTWIFGSVGVRLRGSVSIVLGNLIFVVSVSWSETSGVN
jgi:hypothetical protein